MFAYDLGSVIVNVVGLFFTLIEPPWLSIILLQLDNPKPVPISFEVTRDSKMCGNNS